MAPVAPLNPARPSPASAAAGSTESSTGEWLRTHRPDLADRYHAELPAARAAILGRLWGALAREPIPGLAHRHHEGTDLVAVVGGRRLRGPAAAAEPFAVATAGLVVQLDGIGHEHPARLLHALALPGAATLTAELDDSVANLALARAAQPAPARTDQPALARAAPPLPERGGPAAGREAPTITGLGDTDPVSLEQLVVDGHPLHPCCRSRVGLSTPQVLDYAPEHRPVVDLVLVEIPAGRWLSTGTGLAPRLPLHPWQYEHLRDEHPWLRDTGQRLRARPLMSLRTLAPVREPGWHLKTALDVQMTSAIRTVSPAAVHNGPVISVLLADLARRVGGITVLREVAAGAVLVDGEPCRSLAVIQREAPRHEPGELVLPLAALTARSPVDGRPLAVGAVRLGYAGAARAFLADLARVLVPPLLRLLCIGVALEAHGQNTLIGLRAGRPVRLLYRDLGGVRLHPRRLARHGVQVPPLRGDLVTHDPELLRTKLFAALISTALGELVAVLGRECGEPAEALWGEVAQVVRASSPAIGGGDDAEARADTAALFADRLPVKAMTAMRLAAEPLDEVWAALPNPLAGLR